MFEKLVDIICNYVEAEPRDIHPGVRFMEDLGFTSFDFMSMLGEIEGRIRCGSRAGGSCEHPYSGRSGGVS